MRNYMNADRCAWRRLRRRRSVSAFCARGARIVEPPPHIAEPLDETAIAVDQRYGDRAIGAIELTAASGDNQSPTSPMPPRAIGGRTRRRSCGLPPIITVWDSLASHGSKPRP
jgi:hypothetical protein